MIPVARKRPGDLLRAVRAVRADLPTWRERAEAHRSALLSRYSMERRIVQLQAAL